MAHELCGAQTPSDILPSNSRFLRCNKLQQQRANVPKGIQVVDYPSIQVVDCAQAPGIQVVDCAQTTTQESGNSSIPRSDREHIPE
jgi:hypothetical protein